MKESKSQMIRKKIQRGDEPHEADEVSASSSNDVLYEVEAATMKRIYFALEAARDNAIECYNEHINKYEQFALKGKNRLVANELQKDVDEAESLIAELSSKWSFGV